MTFLQIAINPAAPTIRAISSAMFPRLPGELLDAILAKTTVGSRARLAAVCQPLRDAVREHEIKTPAARLDALRGSDEVLLDLFRFVSRADDPREAGRSFDGHHADTGVTFEAPKHLEYLMLTEMRLVTDRYAGRGTVFRWLSPGPRVGRVSVTINRITFDGPLEWSLPFLPLGLVGVDKVVTAARKLLTLFPDSGHVRIYASALRCHPDEDFLWEFKENFAAMVPALLESGVFVCVP